MDGDQYIWRKWARILQRWGMKDGVASFLEAAGPLSILGAQLVYMGQPILDDIVSTDHMNALVRMLEDTNRTREFVTYLREASIS